MTSEQKRKILHVITGLSDGGAEAVLTRLILNSPQYEHLVVSLSDSGKYGAVLTGAEIRVINLNLSRKSLNIEKFIELCSLIKRESPDVIQTWMYHADLFGGLASRVAGFKNIIWGLHNTTLDKKLSSKITRLIAYVNGRLSHVVPRKVISCSQVGMAAHADLGYKLDKMIYVPNGYDFSVFQPNMRERNEFRTKFQIDDNMKLIGCVARYSPQKDHVNLLKAFKGYIENDETAMLILVGDGMDQDNQMLRSLLAYYELENRVILAGQFDDISPVMSGLDVHVLPSAFGEAFPNVLCEAIACGTICVATNVGDAPHIIEDTRLVCEPRDHDQLKDVIANAFTLKTVEYRMKSRERIVKKYSIQVMVDSYSDVWFGAHS